MTPLRVLLVGPVEAASAMSLLLNMSHHDARWERDDEVTPDGVDWCEVVIADIGLRGRAGRDFVKNLTSGRNKRPIVIVISNESETPPVEAGIDAHLTKPVDPDELVGLVERLRTFYAGLKAHEKVPC